jgi:hypothetical protein
MFDYEKQRKNQFFRVFTSFYFMSNGRKCSECAALLNSDLLYYPPIESLTFDQLRSIRFTHIRIYPTIKA